MCFCLAFGSVCKVFIIKCTQELVCSYTQGRKKGRSARFSMCTSCCDATEKQLSLTFNEEFKSKVCAWHMY